MKKAFAITLALVLCLALFAGCGSSEQSASNAPAPNSAPAAAANENTEASTEPAAVDGDDDEDMAEIRVSWLTLAPVTRDVTDPVVEAVNAITEKEINVHVDIDFYDAGGYATQVPMTIQSGEKLDLLMYTPIPGSSYQSFKAQRQLMDISALLDQYGQGVKDALGSFLDGTTTADGGVYGVCCNRIMNSYLAIVMRTDVLEELGLLEKAQNMTTWTEYEEILKEVVSKTDYAGLGNSDTDGTVMTIVPYFTNAENFADCRGFDLLGDTSQLVCVDEATDTVQSYYQSEQFRQSCERAERWYQEGLIYKDASMSQTYGVGLIKEGVCFSVMANAELGVEESYEAQTGFDLTFVKVADASISSDTTYKFGFAVPVTAQEPEAAVKFLNLLYTNTDLNNIMSWGAPGRDWVEKDGCAAYPDGVDATTVAYHMMDIFGNQFITTPWIDNGPNFRQVQMAEQNNIVFSKYMGFAPETSDFANDQTACFMAAHEYKAGLSAGSSGDCAGNLEQFSQKLQETGIEKVLQGYQTQLDAWLAESAK